MQTYEFDNHKFPSLIEVQKYINPIIKRCKFMSEINSTNMFYHFFISIMKLNRIKIDEKNIYYFFFEKEEYLYVKTQKGDVTILSYHYPSLVRNINHIIKT